MLPLYESQRSQRRVDGPEKPPPDPILIAREIGGAVLARSRWLLAMALILTTGSAVYTFWPEETVQAEIGYTALQDTVIRGNVESITISGTYAEGTFHGTVSAVDGRVIGIGEPMPDGVYSIEDADQANAFTATIPAEARDSFIQLLERQGVDVRVE